MKKLSVLILCVLFSLTTFAQTPKRTPKKLTDVASNQKNILVEKDEFDKAAALTGATEKIAALQKFMQDFPESQELNRALEIIVVARVTLADEKLRSDNVADGIGLFKLAVADAPKPVPDKLFTDIILQIPNNLFFRGERDTALEIAKSIEEKADGNVEQLLALATFYLNSENGAEMKRVAEKALQINPDLPAAYQTLGLAERLDFQLEDSAAAYSKALELNANSTVSKRSLAEMKRATGKASEAVALYRKILAKDASDASAQTGLILALFDAGNKSEAESEMQKSLEQSPNNLPLLVGAAYWYAAQGDGAKAVEFGEKALAVEPRYTWAHIALARGLLAQKRPLDAEKTLLAAQKYGNFPTLDYELAATRFQSGFYREAVEGLQKTFTVRDNSVETKLGGRVVKNAKDFVELLSFERRASIFQPMSADNSETAGKLKSLLDFQQKLAANDAAAAQAAAEFVKGGDNAKIHRQLYVANQMLEKKSNLPEVLELSKAAVNGVDASLELPNSASAVLADELYDSRRLAISRNQLIVVPEVSRQTLSNILRGRIEDLAGWTLFQENKFPEAVIRLKRAVSILPDKSSWWRGSMWRLGAALEADGKLPEALDAYYKGYPFSESNPAKYAVVESLYQKINGNTDGLDKKIGDKPPPAIVETKQTISQPTEKEMPKVEPTPAISDAAQTETSAKIESLPAAEKQSNIPPVRTNDKAVEQITKPAETTKINAAEIVPKPLFEPIIITVPKVEPKKKPATETPENAAKIDSRIEDRPRVVTEKEPAQNAPCKIIVSPETVSIINNGGNLSILVRFEIKGDASEIKATSSSPGDLEIAPEPETDGRSSSSLFIVKSISRKTGIFTITFESACDKKVISVKVR